MPFSSDNLLCKHCDVYVGWGGVGVVKIPQRIPKHLLDDICWCCGRSREEIEQEQEGQ